MARTNNVIKDIYLYRLQTTKARHFLRTARSYIARDLINAHTNAIVNGQVVSVIKGVNAGNLRSKMYDIPRKIQKQVQPITKEFAQKIFAESQRRVPVDKKYIGKFNPDEPDSYTVVKRSRAFDIPVERTKEVQNKVDMSAFYFTHINRKNFTIDKGVYIGSQKKIVDTFFKSSNKRKKYQLYVDSSDNKFHSYNARLGIHKKYSLGVEDLVPATGTTKQKSGGNKELKRSAIVEEGTYGIYKYGYTISYDPTRLGTKFNYAQLQHDRLSYKHTVGESLFLYNAFEKYRDKYYEEVRKATGHVVKEFNNGR